MRTKQELKDMLKIIECAILENQHVNIYDVLKVVGWKLEDEDELRGARKVLLWMLEPKPKKEKKENSHKLKEYGLPENVEIKKN